jgi:putative transcriptional regulator
MLSLSNIKVFMGNEIHNRIAVLRTERNLSRQELAEALGINYQTVGFLERGDYNPSLALAFEVSEFFKLPIEVIFSRTPLRPMSEVLYGHRDENSENRNRTKAKPEEPSRRPRR